MVKKLLTFIFLIILLTVSAVLVFGPNYAKSYLEEHSKELVGRQILMDELDFNAFNGHFLITNLRILEEQDSGSFVQFDSLFTNLKLYKLFSGEFLTEALHIKGLEIDVWKQNEIFNFADLIPETDSTMADTTIETEESFIKKFTINDIQILYSSVNYDDRDLPAIHNLKDINIKVPYNFWG